MSSVNASTSSTNSKSMVTSTNIKAFIQQYEADGKAIKTKRLKDARARIALIQSESKADLCRIALLKQMVMAALSAKTASLTREERKQKEVKKVKRCEWEPPLKFKDTPEAKTLMEHFNLTSPMTVRTARDLIKAHFLKSVLGAPQHNVTKDVAGYLFLNLNAYVKELFVAPPPVDKKKRKHETLMDEDQTKGSDSGTTGKQLAEEDGEEDKEAEANGVERVVEKVSKPKKKKVAAGASGNTIEEKPRKKAWKDNKGSPKKKKGTPKAPEPEVESVEMEMDKDEE
ncbi:hypothetical protein M427DRAFT_49966 [Gonapodya prolifera JEL478]|uniref:Uncharacterized protein n=1 Tax=Gonapodya prolifera (strain JEL478) TaxID=1344416 RepID=A0A138ZXC0_GONPJ|nr:hypothetical protein M427DRAFT_49966 [Gonapodya prolifera JEL478]|eukprot:KXS09104.1 hypothetical protein M427DRAFT_49966 [Gonapodya prolifera JEL478]